MHRHPKHRTAEGARRTGKTEENKVVSDFCISNPNCRQLKPFYFLTHTSTRLAANVRSHFWFSLRQANKEVRRERERGMQIGKEEPR